MLDNDFSNYEVLISEEQLAARVKELGRQITEDYRDSKEVLFVGILKGSVPFLADLIRAVDIPAMLDFMIVSSYGSGTSTSGRINIKMDLASDIRDKDVIIVEDIIDSGLTLYYLTEYLKQRGPRTLRTVTALDKPSRRRVDFVPDYCGFEVEDKFIIGYGLDYDQRYRNLPFISWIKD